MKNVNLDGKAHRTPTVDVIKVIVPSRAIAKWVRAERGTQTVMLLIFSYSGLW